MFTGDAHRPSGERLVLPVNSSRLQGRWVPFSGEVRVLIRLAGRFGPRWQLPGRDRTAGRPGASGDGSRTIEHFEASARRLVLQTASDAHIAFTLAPDAIIRLGSRTLPPAELASHRGRKAKVRFTQANGRRTAHWVVISSDPPRAAQH